MKDIMEMFNSQLLHEVRRDAIKKSQGKVDDERIFQMISYMKLLKQTAYKQGILALEVIAEDIKETASFRFLFGDKIYSTVIYYLDYLCIDDVTETLTARYWAENLHEEDALMYYMLIFTLLKITSDINGHVLEGYLTACISEKKAKKYHDRYKEKFDKEAEKLYNFHFGERGETIFDRQKAEAVLRMKKIGISDDVIKKLEEKNSKSQSLPPYGDCFPIECGKRAGFMSELEWNDKIYIYFTIHSKTSVGDIDVYLYVGSSEELWEKERADTGCSRTTAYIHFCNAPEKSAYGIAEFELTPAGGLLYRGRADILKIKETSDGTEESEQSE